MSSTENHKKMFHILREAKKTKGLLLSVMFQAMEDNPGTIARAYEKVVESGKHGTSGVSPGYGPWAQREKPVYTCKDCHEMVDAIGIAGACIKCDVAGFDTSNLY